MSESSWFESWPSSESPWLEHWGESPWLEHWARLRRELAAQRRRTDALIYGADDSIVFGVDPATEVVVALSRFDGGWVEVLDTHVPETKPEVMWEGGDWLFHVAQGI